MLDPALFSDLRCLHLMGSTLSISDQTMDTGRQALDLALQAGAKFSFDPNLRPELLSVEKARDVFEPFISAADVFIPTESELLSLTGYDAELEAIEFLLTQKSDRVIVVTKGARGSVVYTAQDTFNIPGFIVDEIDPTGAGDCFDAGFLSGWLGGLPVNEAARLANACGALAVTKQGPMAGAEKMARVQEFMVSLA